MAKFHSYLADGYFSGDPDDKSLPVSIRMNNPGALNWASWIESEPGYVGRVETTQGNRTVIFESPEEGVSAWLKLMQKYKKSGYTTVGGIINHYGGGQDYSGYVSAVTKATGYSSTMTVPLVGDDDKLLKFAKAMWKVEAGKATPLSDAQILFGFALARGEEPPPPVVIGPEKSMWQKFLDFLSGFFKSPAPVTTKPPAPGADPKPGVPKWMAEGRKYLGFHETGTNRGIEKFINLAHTGSLGDPWCAIYINAMLEAVGIRGSRSPAARSFERDKTNFVKLSGPAIGAIGTLWRGSPTPEGVPGNGHVFFYAGRDSSGRVIGLAGNDDDGVREAAQDMTRHVGWYWPKGQPLPAIGHVLYTSKAASGGKET